MAGLSSAQLAKIDSALKRANTRIARLEDSFGRSSSTFKNQVAKFEKGSLHKYKGTSASGHWKLDKSKIMKDIRSGALNYDEANEILGTAAGIHINPDGTVRNTQYGGFATRKQLEEMALETIEAGHTDLSQFYEEDGFIKLNKTNLKKIIEYLEEISEHFQIEYKETPLNDEEMKSNPILSKLYSSDNGGSRSKRKLEYDELQEIADELNRVRKDLKKGGEGAKANEFLKNEG